MPAPIPVPVGVTFGRLTITGGLPSKRISSGKTKRMVTADCACGTAGRAYPLNSVTSGMTRSCGCLQREAGTRNIVATSRTHGMSGTAEATAWSQMKARCYTPTHRNYPKTGAVGIRVCDRWLGRDGLANFVSDMGLRPNGAWLRRLDMAADYSASNCKWETDVSSTASRSVRTIVPRPRPKSNVDALRYRQRKADGLCVTCGNGPAVATKTQCASCREQFAGRRETREWKRSIRGYILRRKYGISVADFDRMLTEQGGMCCICLRDGSHIVGDETANHRGWAVDHCHSTGVVRGILCSRCNTSMGALGDTLATVEPLALAMIEYLRRHDSHSIIDTAKTDSVPAPSPAI